MEYLQNPWRGTGLSHMSLDETPWPLSDATRAQALINRCPRAGATPLTTHQGLADALNIAALSVKDERGRMDLGSFKALGAAHVIARDAAEGIAAGRTYVAASAGNHGLSVAAGAEAFGAKSRIYLAETVPEAFAARLRQEGAEVRRAGNVYEESMDAARRDAEAEGLDLLSDSSWPGYFDRPLVLMEGYLILMAEVVEQLPAAPTHIFLQAGVGGLAAAAAAHARLVWGDAPVICVVEPEAAPALVASVRAGGPVVADGPVSIMGRLDCKEPSLIALKGLARDADAFVTLSEEEAEAGTERAAQAGLVSTPSGSAGLAALFASGPHRDALGLTPESRVLTILSETADT